MTTKSISKYNKSFTIAQKEQYKQKKEAEKLEIQDLYTKFLAKKTIQDFIGIIANYKQLHNYSIRNILLLLAQSEKREHKEFVGVVNSFANWKKQNIQILKGSKAYKVRIPIFTKNIDEDSTKPATEKKEKEEEQKKTLSYFKLGNVFDISLTSEYSNYIKEQEQIDKIIMKNHEIDYSIAYNFVKEQFSKLSIIEDFKHQEKKGSYNPHTHQITLYEKSSHTIFHELGHYLSIEVLKIAGDIHKDYSKNEVIAELISYLLMTLFDENTNYNFAYSNCWSNRITETFKLDEFETDFKAITHYLERFTKKEVKQTNGM